MPFEALETVTKETMPPMASLSYMRPHRKDGKKDLDRDKVKPRLILTLPTVVCIAKSERFTLQLGTGDDKGKLRVCGTKDKKGTKPTEFKAHLMFRFGHVPRFGEEIFDGEKCTLRRISDEVYEIDVPFLK